MNFDSLHSRISWEQRLHGFPSPFYSLSWVKELIDGLAGKDPKTVQKGLRLCVTLLSQALVLNPYDSWSQDLFEQISRLCPPTFAFSVWYRVVKTLAGKPGISFQEADSIVNSAGRDLDALAKYAGQGNPTLIRFLGLIKFWELGEAELLLRFGGAFCSFPEGAAVAPFLAWAAWKSGEKDLALELIAKSPENFLTHNLRAEAVFENKDTGAAVKHYLRSLDFEPGQPFLVYRLYETLLPEPSQDLSRNGRVHIFLYTFNKLPIILDTLESLLATNIGQSEITLLNNGSTAFSPEDLDRGVKNIAQGRKVRIIHLPANIGAPAARNWLWRLPETAEAKYVAFLDDDVFLPENWLACYLQDLAQNPETVVVGPKCVNHLPVRTVQYVSRFFKETGDHKIVFTPNAPSIWDLGQYDYRRPCLSVMGCCHLFNRALYEKLNIPDFDIRFSPSQVDDLEHDIQIWKAGGRVLYDGRVHVVHRQGVGRQRVMGESDWGHIWGNHMKMEFKFLGRELQEIDKAVLQEDERFWRQCLEALEDTLPGPAKEFFGMPV